ncbi:hypothetical protein [Winogradskyella forsetii]|nr:hypothetical protein [Winogradskyella forsetii]
MISYNNKKVITKSCDLNSQINDTITIRGVFYHCMEYTGFKTIENDSCQENFDINLNFNEIAFPKDLLAKIYKIEGCTANIKMTVNGILKNDSENGYGHLGSNNAELVVLNVFEIGKLKYIRP